MIFINYICFRSGDRARIMLPPIKCYHIMDHLLLCKKSLIGIQNRSLVCVLSFLCDLYDKTNVLCYDFTYQHEYLTRKSMVK